MTLKPPLTVKEFLFLLATDPKILGRYNDPKTRTRLLRQYLSEENRRLLSDPDVIQIRYSIEVEAKVDDEKNDPSVSVTTTKVPIYPPPIYLPPDE
jgi:hypothetical protein